jgi:membrane protease YdiL (CAAX protease family)
MKDHSLLTMFKRPALFVPLSITLFFIPLVVQAQGTILTLIAAFQQIISALIPFTISLALFAILFGLAKYAFKAGDEKAQAEGRNIMFWGVIILFVMVSVWGFVAILQEFFFGSGYTPTAPTVGEMPLLPTTPAGGSPTPTPAPAFLLPGPNTPAPAPNPDAF